jgi:hypothetical protein
VLLKRDDAYIVGKVLKFYRLHHEGSTYDIVLVRRGEITAQRFDTGFLPIDWYAERETNFFHVEEIQRPVLVQEREDRFGRKLPSLLNDLVDLELRDILRSIRPIDL